MALHNDETAGLRASLAAADKRIVELKAEIGRLRQVAVALRAEKARLDQALADISALAAPRLGGHPAAVMASLLSTIGRRARAELSASEAAARAIGLVTEPQHEDDEPPF